MHEQNYPRKVPTFLEMHGTRGYGGYRKLAFHIQFSFAEYPSDLHHLESPGSLAVRFPAAEWLSPLVLYMILNPQEPIFLLAHCSEAQSWKPGFPQKHSRVHLKLGRGPEVGPAGIVGLQCLKWQLWQSVLEFKTLAVDSKLHFSCSERGSSIPGRPGSSTILELLLKDSAISL